MYPIKNYKYLIRYKLNIPVSEEIKNQISYLENMNLYLSRPFVEDKILSLDEEIRIYHKIINDFGHIIVKFHPREEKEKKDYLIHKLGLNTIKDYLEDLPAEKITLNVKLANLIGTFSNTLMHT